MVKVSLLALLLIGATPMLHAVTLISTDFSGMTIDGVDPNKANNITWTGSGLSAPTSLTLENVIANQNDGQLYDNANTVTTTNGYFGGNTNLSRAPGDGQWGVTIQLNIGSNAITLEEVGLNITHANNSGGIQQNPRDTNVAITVRDTSDLSVVGSVSDTINVPGNSAGGVGTLLTFSSALSLSANGTYDVEFLVDSDDASGHYAAFGNVGFNGEVIPEPSSALLMISGFGLAALLRRRK